jgi:AcrR family transcriptional regulator
VDDQDAPTTAPARRDRVEAIELVLRAFAAAEATGRPDWRHMTFAVLKNRLLDLTDRGFDEGDWGASTLRNFVALLEPVVTVQPGPGPSTAVLSDDVDVAAQSTLAAEAPAQRRGDWSVRQDLWDAVIDYRSGRSYVWLANQVHALVPGEEAPEGAIDLPTVDPALLIEWRRAFAETQSTPDGSELAEELAAWSREDITSRRLPVRMRNQWYGTLKRHVRARLEEWFAQHTIEPPHDLAALKAPPVLAVTDDVEKLRAVVLRAVRAMTAEELRGLMLPATVTARLLR